MAYNARAFSHDTLLLSQKSRRDDPARHLGSNRATFFIRTTGQKGGHTLSSSLNGLFINPITLGIAWSSPRIVPGFRTALFVMQAALVPPLLNLILVHSDRLLTTMGGPGPNSACDGR